MALCAVVLCGVFLWVSNPPPLEEAKTYPAGTVLRDSTGRVIRVCLNEEGQDCRPVYKPSRGDWIVKALIAAEDSGFYSHNGVVLLSVARALRQNLTSFRTVSGASTITMQTVRLIKPHPRNFFNKIFEAVKAVRLERVMSKDEILAQYLNRLPFGSNLIGIEAASQVWFGCRPEELGIAQSALLAGLPQSPSRYRPDRHLDRALIRRNYVLDRMVSLGMITDEQYVEAVSVPIVIRKSPRPFEYPWFCDYVLNRQGKISGDFITTLDPQMQQIASDGLKTLSLSEGTTAAAVILSVRDSSLLAMASTGDYTAPFDGQVNAAAMARPAGSTLKPFAFAVAMESGTLIPETVLPDIPRKFGGYSPANFDGKFRGFATARDSLILSLNLPSIEVLRNIGIPKFAQTLRAIGLSSIKPNLEKEGLGVVLGSVSVRLVELANAYSVFARGGLYKPCKVIASDYSPGALEPWSPRARASESPKARALSPKPEIPRPQVDLDAEDNRVFSPEVSWLMTDMLSGDERSLGALGHNADAVLPRFAWKTGTSAGYRDAWTVAWNPDYVIAVWIGNKQGRQLSGSRTGLSAAAPVVWRIARTLYAANAAPWFAKNQEIGERDVCASTGLIPGSHCPKLKKAAFIKGVSLWTPCTVHSLDSNGNVVEKWPPDIEAGLAALKKNNGMSPEYTGLTIESPVDGAVFKLVGSGGMGKIRCKVKEGTASPKLFWYLNGKFVETLPPDVSFSFPMLRGTFTIAVSDEYGNADEISVSVK